MVEGSSTAMWLPTLSSVGGVPLSNRTLHDAMYQTMYAIRLLDVSHCNFVRTLLFHSVGSMYLFHQLSLDNIATIPQSDLIFTIVGLLHSSPLTTLLPKCEAHKPYSVLGAQQSVPGQGYCWPAAPHKCPASERFGTKLKSCH